MAAGVEESNVESLLTDNEHRLLCEDAERQTAYAVIALSQAATELGMQADLPEAASALRTSMANLSPKEQRKLRKSLERIGTLLVTGKSDTLAEVVSLTDTHHEEQATPQVVVVAKTTSQSELLAADQEPQSEPSELDIKAEQQAELALAPVTVPSEASGDSEQIIINKVATEKFYKRINALSSTGNLLAFEPYDEDEVLGLIALYAHASTKKIGMKSAIRLKRMLEGQGFSEIQEAELAEGYALTVTGYNQFSSMGAPRFVAKHLKELFTPGNKVEEKSAAHSVAQSNPTPAHKPSANPTRTQVVSRERPIGEEPQYVQVALRFAKVLDFDSSQETAWRSILDPANKQGEFTRNKADVCNLIVEELAARGWTNIHDGYFEKLLPSVEAARIYKLLGLPFNPQALVSNRRLPTNASVANQIEEARRNGGQPNEVADQVFRGLATIARELRENPRV